MTKQLFISVGSRLPMNRLLKAVDEFMERNTGFTALAQAGSSTNKLEHFQSTPWLNSSEFEKALIDCDIFISHAGMGNILLASQYAKPIIVMPRLHELGEHINDHQLTTVNGLEGRPNFFIVNNPLELEQAIFAIVNRDSKDKIQRTTTPSERAQLIEKLKQFIDDE